MNLKEIYNPRKVYEGFFETYFIRPYFHHYADFAGSDAERRTPAVMTFLKSLAAWAVATLGIAGILMGLVGLLGPEVGFSALYIVGGIWLALSVTPLLALISRTFVRHTEPEHPKSKMLGIDTMLGVSCLLFFLFGLLMMVTTLNSGGLNPNANMTDEPDTVVAEEEYIKEEPIFTYQDPAPVDSGVDTMSDLTEPDAIDPDESFDPALATPAEDPAVASDSLLF